jgi:hypothetical protein
MFIMQLGSIELLHVNAQPLCKVKITKQNPREGYAIGASLAQGKESYSRRGLANVVPQELLDHEWH